MEEFEFTIGGRVVRLTRQKVIESVQEESPEPVQTWAAEIDGRLFPVKQVLACATGVNRGEFISHRARDILRRLGFRVADVQRGPAGSAPGDGGLGDQVEEYRNGRMSSVRLAALTKAIEYVRDRPTSEVEDVLEAAERFEAWLAR